MSANDPRDFWGRLIPSVGEEQIADAQYKTEEDALTVLKDIRTMLSNQATTALTGAAAGPAGGDIAKILAPLAAPSDMISMLLEGQARKDVKPIVVRGAPQIVPAGTTVADPKVFYEPIPGGYVGMIVDVHTMYVAPDNRRVTLVEHKEDNYPPSISNATLDKPLVVGGSYLFPVHKSITHVLTNTWWHDVYFTDFVEAILISENFYTNFWEPYWKSKVSQIETTVKTFGG